MQNSSHVPQKLKAGIWYDVKVLLHVQQENYKVEMLSKRPHYPFPHLTTSIPALNICNIHHAVTAKHHLLASYIKTKYLQTSTNYYLHSPIISQFSLYNFILHSPKRSQCPSAILASNLVQKLLPPLSTNYPCTRWNPKKKKDQIVPDFFCHSFGTCSTWYFHA